MTKVLISLAKLNSVDSMAGVIKILENLEEELPNSQLKNLKFFNRAYLIISRNMYGESRQAFFKDLASLEKLDLIFAHFYFQEIFNFENGQEVLPAWQMAFNIGNTRKNSELLNLALGANAHINNDLALALEKTVKKESFYSDYQKAGQVINFSVAEILNSIDRRSTPVRLVDKLLRGFYKLFVRFMIGQWRKLAWENYLRLKEKKITEVQIKEIASRKAGHIVKIAEIIPL